MGKNQSATPTGFSAESASVGMGRRYIAVVTGNGAMKFLLRAVFWGGLVLVLLPTGAKNPNGSQIKASEAASAASATVADLSNFCTREPASCAVGAQIASLIGHRAEAGARLIYAFLTEHRKTAAGSQQPIVADRNSGRREITGSIATTAAPTPVSSIPLPRARPFQDTLTAADRRPTWHRPQLQQEARLLPRN